MGVDTAQQVGGLVGWVLEYGQIVGFFAQLAFWAAVSAASVWAAWTFKRLTDHLTGARSSKPAASDSIAVEEFVE